MHSVLSPTEVKAVIAKYKEEDFTDWFSGSEPPYHEGVYLVKWNTTSSMEFSLFAHGQWKIPHTNPNVHLYLNKDYVVYLKWRGLVKDFDAP